MPQAIVKPTLIIEDSAYDRRVMQRLFDTFCPRAELLQAPTLTEAREVLQTRSVGLIFLDNALPDGWGSDFVVELAVDPALRDIPIIMLTDFPTPFMYAKAAQARACTIWSKGDLRGPAVSRAVEKLAGRAA